jgi:hypothetical protein
MKKLFTILLIVLSTQGAFAQGFNGSALTMTVGRTPSTTYNYASFAHVLNSVYLELGSGNIQEEQFVSATVGYVIQAGTKSYIAPTVTAIIDKNGIRNFTGGIGISLITHFSEQCFIVTGVGVNQPAKIGIGYKF